LAADALLPAALTSLTIFLGSDFAFVDAGTVFVAVVVFAGVLAVALVGALAATPFAALLLATTFAGLTTVLAATLATGLTEVALVAVFVAGLLAVLLVDLVGLFDVVIFETGPDFRLAAFFSVALGFVKIFFALEATESFAGFFML
jgi:hypothetical protein